LNLFARHWLIEWICGPKITKNTRLEFAAQQRRSCSCVSRTAYLHRWLDKPRLKPKPDKLKRFLDYKREWYTERHDAQIQRMKVLQMKITRLAGQLTHTLGFARDEKNL
jgi:hypothetical protein